MPTATDMPAKPRKLSHRAKWIFLGLPLAAGTFTVASGFFAAPIFVVFLLASGLLLIGLVLAYIAPPSPFRLTPTFVAALIIVVVAAGGTYANVDSVIELAGTRSDRDRTANTLARYVDVRIGRYTDEGLPVTIHSRSLDFLKATVVIEATTSTGVVIAVDRRVPRLLSRQSHDVTFFDGDSGAEGLYSGSDAAVVKPFLRDARFTVVYAIVSSQFGSGRRYR